MHVCLYLFVFVYTYMFVYTYVSTHLSIHHMEEIVLSVVRIFLSPPETYIKQGVRVNS